MGKNMNGLFPSLNPKLIIHPGVTIKEILEERKISQEELAIRTGYSAKHISEIISGKKNISSKFANSLEYALNINTQFWINLQGIYDKEILELQKLNNINNDELNILNDLKEITNFCKKNEIIENSENNSLTIMNLRKFLNVNNLTAIPNLPFQQTAFRGSKKNKINIYVLYAWQKLCEYYTQNIKIEKSFDPQKLKQQINEIKKTMFLEIEEMVKKLKQIFANCGIAFEIVKHFTGAPVQGFIQKNNNKIILCLTLRKSYSDIFWFTLFHEIHHLLNNDYEDKYIDYTFIDSLTEKKADEFAKNCLINDQDYCQFKEKGDYSYEAIKKFANTQNVLPGIIIGRIQNDINDFAFMSKFKEQYKWSE